VKYTEPHSAFIPAGAVTDGFSFTQGSSVNILSWGEGFIVSYDKLFEPSLLMEVCADLQRPAMTPATVPGRYMPSCPTSRFWVRHTAWDSKR